MGTEQDADLPEELSAAERYGVKEFDLERKGVVVDVAKQYMPKSGLGIGGFCAAINALHFDAETGRLVSLEDARAISRDCEEARQAFERFLDENKNLL